jgi:hypothetical protein
MIVLEPDTLQSTKSIYQYGLRTTEKLYTFRWNHVREDYYFFQGIVYIRLFNSLLNT